MFAPRGILELSLGEARARDCDSHRLCLEYLRELRAEHDRAARDADDEDIETDADACPEVNLKQRSAQPHFLRTPQPIGVSRHQPRPRNGIFVAITVDPCAADGRIR